MNWSGIKRSIGFLLLSFVLVGCGTSRIEKRAVQPSSPSLSEPPVEVVELPQLPPIAPVVDSEDIHAPAMVEVTVPAVPALAPPATVQLKTNPLVNGWYSLSAWSVANGFSKPQKVTHTGVPVYSVSTPTGVMTFKMGNRVMQWNGIKVWLGFTPQILKGELHIHALDAEKNLLPLIQPSVLAKGTNRVLVIDPGHGGVDSGTKGNAAQLEKNFVLDWALRLRALLVTNGWTVFLTRTNDVDVPLASRVALADRVNADLFLSLHFNSAFPHTQPSGLETYCLTPQGMTSNLIRNFGDNPQAQFPNNAYDTENLLYAYQIHRGLLAATRGIDGGVRRARFMTVLREQHCPAVLVEGGYLSNPQEALRVSGGWYRQNLAVAVAKALE